MIVVCNTTPLINFATIGEVDLFAKLFGRIFIPTQVSAELNEKIHRFPMLIPLINAPFIQVETVQNQLLFQTLKRDLDDGEAAALVLAIEIRADLVVMDEMAGREMAAFYRLPVIGSIGCLIEAKQRQIIINIRPYLNAMRTEARFWINNSLYTRILRDVGEL